MMNRIKRTSELSADEKERMALTRADYAAARVEFPNWTADPIPSLQTWRCWQDAENRTIAHKRAADRIARDSLDGI